MKTAACFAAVATMPLFALFGPSLPEALAHGRSGNPDAGVVSPDAGQDSYEASYEASYEGPPADGGAAPGDTVAPVNLTRITGTALVPESVARAAVGPAPTAGESAEAVHAWGVQAALRIVDEYRARGYLYARAWFSERKEPGVLWFDVDEGRMRVAFVGMSSITAALFRLRLNLLGGVYQKDELEKSLAEQKKAFALANVYYRVHELEGYEVTVFGDLVPSRTLEIHVVRHESFGWGLDIAVSATWGVVPSLKYSAKNVLWDRDQLFVNWSVAVPYRRYIFDAAPRITWVHGGVDASYRFPAFWALAGLAPRVDAHLYLSQYSRADLRLSEFYLLRDATVANIVSAGPPVEVSVGLGADVARLFFVRSAPVDVGSPSTPSDVYSARTLVRATAKWTSSPSWSRRDWRTFANLLVDISLPFEVRATAWGQYSMVSGRHRVFLRARALVLAGQVPFWDDVELAGDYQRVFFGDLYWAHRAAQAEAAYRIKLWRDWFEIGAFHDLSIFEDRISMPASVRVMNGFGPSLHFLILDQYALGVYQGIGFAPGAFSQTITFSVQSVF